MDPFGKLMKASNSPQDVYPVDKGEIVTMIQGAHGFP